VGESVAAANHYQNWLKYLGDIDDNELLATIHNDLGLIYFEKKDYIASNEHHSLAFAQAQSAPFPIGFSVFYGNQGGTQMELKNYSQALDMYRRALNIEQQRRPKNVLNIGRLYSNMGAVHYCLRQYHMALGCFQAAFKMQKRISLSHAIDLATTCHNLGNVYKDMDDHVQAEKFYAEAYKIVYRSLPEGHRTVKLFESDWNASRDKLVDIKEDVRPTKTTEISYPTGRRNSDISVSQINIES
jgi:tetratricopeptide (TPR) repeat protein